MGKNGIDTKSTDDDSSVMKMSLKIPFNLQKQLVADWERIHKHELMSLPYLHVEDILEKWAAKERRKKHTPIAQNTIKIVTKGLTDFFDSAHFRSVFFTRSSVSNTMMSQKKSKRKKTSLKPSKTYGAEHFLRLFVKLPDLLLT